MAGIVGFCASTLISYCLIVLNVPVLIIPFFLLALYIFLKQLKGITIKFDRQAVLTLAVFIIGIAGQLAIISPSGSYQNGNLVFWSSNGHDGAWHIALMEELKKGWPLQNPAFAGERLVNYHFFSDILPAMASKYLPISDLDLYFRIFPFFYSLFLGVAAYFLTKKITHSSSASLWAVFFTYFAGSFGYVIGKGESVFWASQPQSASGNPPQIISDFLILTAVYFLLSFLQKKNKSLCTKLFAICILLFGTLTSFKVYAGVVLLIALGFTGIWQFLTERKIQLLLLAAISGILTAVLYFPNTSGSASFLIFQPWWYIRTMIVEPSRLNLLDWELRRQTYIHDHNWKRVIFLEGVGFLIFFFGNLGMRFVGLWNFLKSHLIIKLIIILSIALPLLFLQKGVASNTSQFLQYYILFFGILAGITTAQITSKVKILIPLLILLMVPTQIGLIHDFYSRPAFAQISAAEMSALTFLKTSTGSKAVILTPPYNQDLNLGGATPNIWDWFDTAYVSAFSARRTYFDDYEQADIMGYNGKPRLATKQTIFGSTNEMEVKQAIAETKADILYYPKAEAPKIDPKTVGLTLLFENAQVLIWKIN